VKTIITASVIPNLTKVQQFIVL